MIFLRHELFWFCLVQVSTTQFCSFPAFLMARVSDGTNVPIPPAQASSSNFGSPNGSGSDLDGLGTRSGSTTDEKLDGLLSKSVHFDTQIAQIPALTNWTSRMDSHITKTLGDFATKLTEMEHSFSTLTARCARSRHMQPQHQMYLVRQDPGLHSNKLTAPQPQGPWPRII